MSSQPSDPSTLDDTRMAAKKGSRLQALKGRIRSDPTPERSAETGDVASRRPTVLDHRRSRMRDLGDTVAGKATTIRRRAVAPSRVRLWTGHNRDYAALNAERCQDLIDGFGRMGQQMPAIVRRVENDPDYDFELVCGARRHWTATHLGTDLVIEERALDDRESFLLMDAENRDRQDISDHERALDYLRAVDLYFDSNRTRMADYLGMDKGNFSKLLRLADMPAEIVEAYADRRELVVHHGQLYAKALAAPASRRRLLAGARDLHGSGLPGRRVFAHLRGVIEDRRTSDRPTARNAARETVGSVSWRMRAPTASDPASCELVFPAPGDRVALERLRAEVAIVLERLGERAGSVDPIDDARPNDAHADMVERPMSSSTQRGADAAVAG